MMYVIVLILVLFNINSSHQLTMHCDFKVESVYLGTKYACVVKSLTTTFRDRRITEVVGDHHTVKSHNDVKMLFIKFQNIPYLPHNVGEFFPNLETFYVMKSNVQHLISGDLDGLDKLIHFDVSHNPVELIEKDFFKNHKKLTKISFHDCHLKKVEKGAFDGLSAIQLLELNYNDCITGKYPGTELYTSYYFSYRAPTLQEFIKDVYDKCTGAGRLLKEQETIQECKADELNSSSADDYGLFFKFGIVMICFLVIAIIFLAYVTFDFYNKNFKNEWNEVNFNVVSSHLNNSY